MAREPLYRTNKFYYHVTARSNNREYFYVPPQESWNIFTRSLSKAAEKYKANIHTFVLMSNHFHMLISTPESNLDCVMRYSLAEATRSIQKQTSRINHIMGARYKWNVLVDPYSLAYVYKYVFRNPVLAGLCAKVEDYAFSSLNNLQSPLAISSGIDRYWQHIPKNFHEKLTWLNQPTKKECEDLIKNGLRRFQFSFSKGSYAQKLLRELKETYGVEPVENSDTI
jgi:REP element-mobilizing transposase RayT